MPRSNSAWEVYKGLKRSGDRIGLLALSTLLSQCGSNNPIIGTWHSDGHGHANEVTFSNESATGETVAFAADDAETMHLVNYTIQGSVVLVSIKNSDKTLKYEVIDHDHIQYDEPGAPKIILTRE